MAKCPACGHDVISVLYGTERLLLDPTPKAYVVVDEHKVYAEDGDRVFLSTALVDHRVLCTGQRRQQAEDRTQGKTHYDRQKAAKKGASA